MSVSRNNEVRDKHVYERKVVIKVANKLERLACNVEVKVMSSRLVHNCSAPSMIRHPLQKGAIHQIQLHHALHCHTAYTQHVEADRHSAQNVITWWSYKA